MNITILAKYHEALLATMGDDSLKQVDSSLSKNQVLIS